MKKIIYAVHVPTREDASESFTKEYKMKKKEKVYVFLEDGEREYNPNDMMDRVNIEELSQLIYRGNVWLLFEGNKFLIIDIKD